MKTLDGSRLKPLNHPSVSIAASILWTEPAFRYQVISADPNDNKFTDCAITANADYVIPHDATNGETIVLEYWRVGDTELHDSMTPIFRGREITKHGGARYITNDKDFSPLANAGYRPQPITPEEFVLMHLAGRSAP